MNKLSSLAEKLERLSQMPLCRKDDMANWNVQAKLLTSELRALAPSVYDSLPHFIEHYLSDSDIRLSDPKYRQEQQSQIEAVIKELKKKANQSLHLTGSSR